MRRALAASLIVSALCLVRAQESPTDDAGVSALMRRTDVQAALDAVKAMELETIQTQIRLAEIPAPPFKEAARGAEMRRLFEQLGLQQVRVDRAGNVLGERPGMSPRPHVVIAAHLDTVFPDGTNVRVVRDGSRLRGPGIADNARGLAVLVAIVRALNQAHVETSGPITFVADVGEEGLGDLRGMKALFGGTIKERVDRFVSIDGAGLGVAASFVGSLRYRVTFKGPGGHSFAAFGTPSPIGALGRAVAKISAFEVPQQPQTTFNVGRIGGGTSVNAIAGEAWMEVDLRSTDSGALKALDAKLHAATAAAVAEENARWRAPGVITVTTQRVGDRPTGATSPTDRVVQAALAATRALGATPISAVSSSDANYPTSLRIPSVEIGGGGAGTGAHALEETFETTDSWVGTARAVLLTIALARE